MPPRPLTTAERIDPVPISDAPNLTFVVQSADKIEFAAVPTIGLMVRISEAKRIPIRSILLQTQVRIAALRRLYDAATCERLRELFGIAEQWSTAGRSLLWAQTVITVPAFTGYTDARIPIACTYDFETAAAKYFYAVDRGEIPLELLFSGTVFYDGSNGLQTCLIPWSSEAEYRLPVETWKATMERYFPNSAWLRLRRDVFDRLNTFKNRHNFPDWEAAIDALLTALPPEP